MTLVTGPTLSSDGWTLLPGLLTGFVVAEVKDAVGLLRGDRGVHGCDRPNNTLIPLRWADALVGHALAAPGVEGVIRSASGGGDLRWTSAYLSLKDPFSGPLWWHADWWAWDHPVTGRPQAAQIAVLCYLNDTSSDTGALRLLPGSHLHSVPLHGDLPAAYADPAAGENPLNPAMADHPDQVTVAATAGDAVVIDYRLLHGTHANRRNHLRSCLILNFAPDWSRLPDDVRAHLARGLALPSDRSERALAGASPLAHLIPPPPDPSLGDLPLSRTAPANFANDAQVCQRLDPKL